jgi:hypothetical protein
LLFIDLIFGNIAYAVSCLTRDVFNDLVVSLQAAGAHANQFHMPHRSTFRSAR